MNPMIIAVLGPTASGKTSLSIKLAQKFNGEIICCDSMQVYKYMEIGTASPTIEELSLAKHHMLSFVDPLINYNAALYQKDARKIINDIHARGKNVVLCGGTGLYAKAVLYNKDFTTANTSESYRERLEDILFKNSNQYLHDMLKDVDPESAYAIHPNNTKRVIRALEIHHLSGIKKSDQLKVEKLFYKNVSMVGFTHDRAELYKRIDSRVNFMIENGLEKEARNLYDMGVSKHNNSIQGIGYKEFFEYFDNTSTEEKCIDAIKKASRNYAKRQLTWFNRMNIDWFDYNHAVSDEFTKIYQYISNKHFIM